ncbi:MAG: hypothetical protein HUK20_01520 [Fibrobacter sp.]|nr:hypothetical protein [Fibrobacter sp.]
MPDYYPLLAEIAKTYRYPKDMRSIKDFFKRHLQKQFGIRFIEPHIDHLSGLFNLPHPSGSGWMHDWLIDPNYGNLDTREIARIIVERSQYLP